jgi:hypothetical protein
MDLINVNVQEIDVNEACDVCVCVYIYICKPCNVRKYRPQAFSMMDLINC